MPRNSKFTRKTTYYCRMIRILSILMGFIFLAIAAAGFYVNSIWQESTTASSEMFIVPKGKGLNWVADELERKKIIPNANIFKLYQRLKYNEATVKAGEFDLSKSLSQAKLIEKLNRGDVIAYQITLIDGWSFKQFKNHLSKEENLISKIADMSDKEILAAIGAENSHPEGLFAPETYFYQKGDSDLDILKRSYVSQQKILANAWKNNRNKNETLKHIDTPYKALILASIVEKETGKESERETISGVFYNRLKVGMKLQTDPTVIYGMGERYKGNIRRKDLTTDTIYNTYTRYGLPPTPIAMPGKASILAALNPKKTDAIFFVGKGDGSHYFSKTLKEHNRAVAKYQLGR